MSRVEWIKNPDDFPPRGSPVGGGSAGGQLGAATVKGQMMLGQDMLFYGGYLPSPVSPRIMWGRAADAERTPLSYNTGVSTRLTWLAGSRPQGLGDQQACDDIQAQINSQTQSLNALNSQRAAAVQAKAGADAVNDQATSALLAGQINDIDETVLKVKASIKSLNTLKATCMKLAPACDESTPCPSGMTCVEGKCVPIGPGPKTTSSSSSGAGWGLLLLAGSAALAIFKGLS